MMSDTAGSRRDGSVDQLLLEAGLDGDAGLRPVLLELRALGSVAPQPTAELLALMSGANGPAGSAAAAGEDAVPATSPRTAVVPAAVPADELAARRRTKRRVTLTALSVAVSLSAGGAVAAASDQAVRNSFSQLNQAVTSFITGSGGGPEDDQAQRPAAPVPTAANTAPAGAGPAGSSPSHPALIPADPAAATQPTAGPPSNGPAAEESAARPETSPGKPGDVPASENLPGAVPGHIAEVPGAAREVPVPSQVPLPGTLPAVPLP